MEENLSMAGLPERKHPRLKEYDYSRNGCYFVTINTEENLPVLSVVGRGLAPAEPVAPVLSDLGVIAQQQLSELEQRYSFVRIDRYIIMPTHIHAIIVLSGPHDTAGASPRPTLMDIICTYKSLTTRLCNRHDGTPGRKLFQTSFYDHIIRSEQAYCEICHYIDSNPTKWLEQKP